MDFESLFSLCEYRQIVYMRTSDEGSRRGRELFVLFYVNGHLAVANRAEKLSEQFRPFYLPNIMTKLYLKHILLCLCLLAGMNSFAYVEIGGIYYELGGNEATVTSGSTSYSGSVVIPASVTYDGKTYDVTAIGDYAFYNYNGYPNSVRIPESVKAIGDYAFYDCYYCSIDIPQNVTSIGRYAFAYCYSLTSATLPICKIIGDGAFSRSGLTSLTLSESLTSIGAYAFNVTPWYDNQPDGLVYAGKVAYKYKGTMPEGTEIEIEDGTVGIAGEAFYNYSNLTSITIPESVTTIGANAFYNTSWYNNQPDGLVYAGKVAYRYKGTMPSGTRIRLQEGTLSIAAYAFYNYDNLVLISIPGSVTNIGDYAFYDCGGLASASIPNSVTSIGQYAFYYCYNLNSILIPESVTSIGTQAFNRNGAYSISVSEGNPKYDSRNGCDAIIETAKNRLITGCAYSTIPDGVESIGDYAFYYCGGLRDISIPNSVKSIGRSAFSDCSNLTSATFPGVTSIGDYAFAWCSRLGDVNIPSSVTSIGSDAFWCCDAMTSITIPSSVAYIGSAAFSHCNSVTSITVNAGNAYYDSREGCNAIIETATNTLIAGCNYSTIPESVTSLASYAFWDCERLTSVNIPENLTSIGYGAFAYCSKLASINIPNAVNYIGNYAFTSCSLLSSVTIPNGVSSIGEYTFNNCTSLTKVTIGAGVKYIYRYAFNNCVSLTDVYCYAEGVPNATYENVFGGSTDISWISLHVPESLVEAYETTSPWSDFGEIVAISADDMEQCAKPTISYTNGKLTFDCATKDVGYIYDIQDDDIKSGAGSKVNLSVTYNISVYATRVGYKDSETANATLCWIDQQPTTEGLAEDAILEMKALPVLIQTEGSTITVQGAENGTPIYVYATDGMQQATAIAVGGGATLNTSLQPGSVAIVKIGERTVKVLMK